VNWSDRWDWLVRGADRLPFWLKFIVLPPVMPLWLVVAAARHYPRTMIFAVVVLGTVYVPLIASGVLAVSWWRSLTSLAWLYVALMLLSFLSLFQGWAEKAVDRWLNLEASPERPQSSLGLWDREIDG
jgi:hypothetical protein